MLSRLPLDLVSLVFSILLACGDGSDRAESPSLGGAAGSAGGAPGGAAAVDGGLAGAATTCLPGQRILENDVVNGRDLGAVPLDNDTTVSCQKIYRAASLVGLSEVGCAAFADLGIRTVIDLRMPDERSAAPNASCVDEHATQILAPLPIPYNVSPTDYIAILDATESMAAAFAAFGDADAYPIYLHCTYGRDRSGVLAALVLQALGASRDAIVEEYLLTEAAGLSSYPDSLAAALDEIENRGGIEAYLASLGVSAESLQVLRATARVP